MVGEIAPIMMEDVCVHPTYTWRLDKKHKDILEPVLKSEYLDGRRNYLDQMADLPTTTLTTVWDEQEVSINAMDLYERFYSAKNDPLGPLALEVPWIFRIACKYGLLEFAQWLYSKALTPDARSMLGAGAKTCYFNFAQVWGFQHAVLGGHVDLVKWMHTVGMVEDLYWYDWALSESRALPTPHLTTWLVENEASLKRSLPPPPPVSRPKAGGRAGRAGRGTPTPTPTQHTSKTNSAPKLKLKIHKGPVIEDVYLEIKDDVPPPPHKTCVVS